MSFVELKVEAKAEIAAVKARLAAEDPRGSGRWRVGFVRQYLAGSQAKINSLKRNRVYTSEGPPKRTIDRFYRLGTAVIEFLYLRASDDELMERSVLALIPLHEVMEYALEHTDIKYGAAIVKEVEEELRRARWVVE